MSAAAPAPTPVWLRPGFHAVGDGAAGVAAIVATLAAGERENRLAILPRRGEPALGAPGSGFAVALETSGTTGPAKAVRHDLARLCGRLRGGAPDDRWLLTYHPCAFAGLQVILTAAQAGATLIAAAPGADVARLAALAIAERATHISGTPSFWRGFLMSCPSAYPPLQAATLGGEAADQALLDHLRVAFPAARLRHIYASTEAGALFAVADGREGFPAVWLTQGVEDVELRLAMDGELLVRSPRAMLAAADGGGRRRAADDDGWLFTGDLVEIHGDRALFRGRKDGRVNVGGVKVSPEEAEALILAVEGVADALVTAQPNPMTGNLLTATIVPRPNADAERLRQAVREALTALPPAARPRILTFADAIALTPSGKKPRTAP